MASPLFFTNRAALSIIIVLILTSAISPAFAEVIKVATDKDTYVLGEPILISGTATPNSAVTIRLFNPAGVLVALDQVMADTTGAYATRIITSKAWVEGIYTLRAFDSMTGLTAEKKINLIKEIVPPKPPVPEVTLQVSISVPSVFAPGDTVRAYVLFTFAGKAVDPTITTATVVDPRGAKIDVKPTIRKVETGWYYLEYRVTLTGIHAILVSATAEGTDGNGQATFQVMPKLATTDDITRLEKAVTDSRDAISKKLDDVSKALTDSLRATETRITTSLGDAQRAIVKAVDDSRAAITGAVSSAQAAISGAVSGIKTDVGGLKGTLDSISAGVSSATTFILVVAALVVITLVLELVILVRRLR
ncbi:MAG: hypothetical protein RMJ31_07100 [Nitrososphaerota archaeon]|nr:hypothetical protein [Nitrososphaerales archaeon]MDW8045517.1 hypothetical protein [Nitrososphaerota archaeon]